MPRALRRLGLTAWGYLALIFAFALLGAVVALAVPHAHADDGATDVPADETPRPILATRAGRFATRVFTAADAIERAFPEEAQRRFLRIATCESELDPRALNRRSGTKGLLQIAPIWQALADEMFPPHADLYDPYVNAAVAAVIFDRQGYAAWECRGD